MKNSEGSENSNLSSNCDKDEEEFESSELGTKEFWEETYKLELDNFRHHGDIGDVWFGEESATRVINWIKSNKISLESSILDIGCGNGISLSYLADEGYSNLFGVDYCEDAIALANAVAAKRETPITYETGNIAERETKGLLKRNYDVCHDKGTFDAISLDPEDRKHKMQIYIQNVSDMLHSGGLLILTSCNWTESELLSKFKDNFEKLEVIPTPVFQFGGKTGSTVTSLVLKKL